MATENRPDKIKIIEHIGVLVKNEDLSGLHELLAFYNDGIINAIVGKAMCDVISDLDAQENADGKMNRVSDYLLSKYGIPANVFDKAVHTLAANGWPFDFPYLMRREDITEGGRETLRYCMVRGVLNAGTKDRIPELAKMCCLMGLPKNVQLIALETLEAAAMQCGKDRNFIAIAQGFEALRNLEMSIAAIGKQQPKVAERLETLRMEMESSLIQAVGETTGGRKAGLQGRVNDVEQLVELFSAVKSPRTRERMVQEVLKQLAAMENTSRLSELAIFTLPGLEEKLPSAIRRSAIEGFKRVTGTTPVVLEELKGTFERTFRPPARRLQEPPNGGVPLKRQP